MKTLRISMLAAATLLSSPALAQQATPDPRAIADAAEQAALQAERAAADAQRAAAAAREAANAAHALAEGRPLTSGPPGATATLPADENLSVDRGSTSAEAEHEAFAAGIGASVANGPNTSALKSTPLPDFQLLASTKDKVGTISWSLDVSGQPHPGRLSADQLTLTASGKLDDDGNGSILGLDGLGNGSEVKLSYTHYVSAVHLTGIEKNAVATARVNCLAQLGATAKACDPYGYATGVSAFVGKYNPAGLRPLLAEVMPGPVYFFGLDLSGNQAGFKYVDRTAFAIKKVSHVGFGGGVFAGLLLGQGQTAIIGSFNYKRSWDPADDVSLCQPISGTTLTQCLTGADGVPTQSKRGLLGLELRHAFPAVPGSFASFAISPKFTIDVTSGEYSIGAPVYLVTDGDGKLRGGVQGTYTNKKDKDGKRKGDFALGLFIGVPFTIFP